MRADGPGRLPLVSLALLCLVPLCAQAPLFTDGPGFGGSKVFSDGINPLGNSARYDQPLPGWYFTYLDGDQRAKDNKSIVADAGSGDAAVASAALARLKDAPWAMRTRAYGFATVKEGVHCAFTREELNGALAHPDLDPTRLGSTAALALNGTTLDGRRVTVDRMSFGSASAQNGTSFGGSLRLERWSMGQRSAARNPGPDQFALSGVDDDLLGFKQSGVKTLTYSMDLGFSTELAQGLRMGVTVDQLNSKRLWDVSLKPQFRAGLQFDLGGAAKLSLESDINGTERMPFPVKQQASAASLRISTSPAVAFILGLERRKVGDSTVNRGGISLQLRTPSFLLGLGFQLGQDSPLKGATLMVN